MKISEITRGITATLQVRSTDGPFDPLPQREDEVGLVRSGDQTLLTIGRTAYAVEGVSRASNTELTTVVCSGLPLMAYVAQAGPEVLVVETRRFSRELRVPEPMQIGLDDKALDDIRRGHRVDGTVAFVAAWLADRLLAPPPPQGPPELRRLVISADARGRLDAFRIYGHRIAADIRLDEDKLRIERVLRGGGENSQRIELLYAAVTLLDATLAGKLHGAVRTTLSEAVSADDSYLRTWQTYHRMEKESILRRARAFGALEYEKCERRHDGGWTFYLAAGDDVPGRLKLLGESGRFELEAGEHPPSFAPEPDTGKPQVKRSGPRRLSAAVSGTTSGDRAIELAPPDEDEDQPKPPERGYLYLSRAGDETRLRRRERAELALRTGDCPIPQLGLLIEGRPAPMARLPTRSAMSPAVRAVFAPGKPTQRQLEAIERALNTPDACLIQGPPGTGKTKVITAIGRRLAELADEGAEPSHRILVTAAQNDAVENVARQTSIFGLPAVTVARSGRGRDTEVDPVHEFSIERIEALRALVRTPPEAERLARARGLAVACFRTRSHANAQAARIRELVRALDGLVSPGMQDRALERAVALERPRGAGDPEEEALRLQAARAIRVELAPFSDDGPIQAKKALRRLGDALTAAERGYLERCAALELASAPAWIAEGRRHREALIDRLSQARRPPEAGLDEETQRLLIDLLDAVDRRLAATRAGEDAAVAAFLRDLESEPDAVRAALEHYTVVLASTLQYAASDKMRHVRGLDEGQATFESVIVDEAARANPLDLFIPMSMAKRRVVLVGDHRQLPQLLEPDVERELAEGIASGTVQGQALEAVRSSLFERLWVKLRALEDRDGIRRTVTLDTQYRMHPLLGRFVSEEFYEVHGDGEIESPRAASEFSHALPGYTNENGACAAAWLDVPADRGCEIRGVSKSRPAEALAIANEVRRIIDHDPSLTYGVISFYAAQVAEIGQAMIDVGLTERSGARGKWRIASAWEKTYDAERKRVDRLRIGTVDAFQGREFDVVLLSVTRTNDLPGTTDEAQRRKYGHLLLDNRLCVAMSRQRRLLVVVGDLAFVRAAGQFDDGSKASPTRPLHALREFSGLCRGPHGTIR